MPRQVKSNEDELFALCDEIQAIDGKVTAARLREAAGGGGHIRLKAVVEAWRGRQNGTAEPAEDSVPETAGRGRGQAGKSQSKGGRPEQDAKTPAQGRPSRRRSKVANDGITLEDAEQAEIAMEAGRVKAALSGGNATKTETPDEPDVPSSIEQAEAEVTEALDAIAVQESEDAPALGTEVVNVTKSNTQPLEETADAPAWPAPTSPKVGPSVPGADAEIARLQAHVEDLRRENGMLWDQVRHEREARIREIELLNGMIQGMRR
ncbi:hypothetical protein SAE02_70910 [Skermanella aerolata]|uniref:Uncharacterized protein n=1 Tax=Skermanella aerolata TaxID=393310 RepID=A0A512E2I0_9PROT|nr:hypothetical protein [Skermanella aerolata]KJB90741.1 hypothetical protein N826_36375 [Skermanella aerolata KACC 11604]GEO42943.1 hypothetical protein SAE02_70910 [Skermanella aerolata]